MLSNKYSKEYTDQTHFFQHTRPVVYPEGRRRLPEVHNFLEEKSPVASPELQTATLEKKIIDKTLQTPAYESK